MDPQTREALDNLVRLESTVGDNVQNHFEPPPWYVMVPVAEAAVELAKAGDLDTELETPWLHTNHGHLVPVRDIIDALGLQPFVDEDS